jgi:hypothetical protein
MDSNFIENIASSILLFIKKLDFYLLIAKAIEAWHKGVVKQFIFWMG